MKPFQNLPPFTRALLSFSQEPRDDYDTPGHHSGAFFRLTEEGQQFVDGLGTSMFRSDISDSSSVIGDPSSHEGVSGEAEALAAKAWHSDRCFFVLGGTSASNRIAVNALLAEGDLVLFDRNNHKSTYQGALVQAGAVPVYLESERNGQGIIGGLTADSLSAETLRKKALALSPQAAKKERPFRLACLQLATYDGLFLNVRTLLEKISSLCDYILFDGAWAGYENFLPLLKDSAVLSFSLPVEAPGILVSQSVHKQLAGFSMTSQIHKKDRHLQGQARCLPDDLLQSTYLMHISTSPYYPLLAGLEMNALLHETQGAALWEKAFRTAIHWKKDLLKSCHICRPFLPPRVHGKPWESYSTETILKDPAFFTLSANESWHRFSHALPKGYLLDPCKLLLTTGSMAQDMPSIPAPLLSAYLEKHHITPEKSDFYSLLFLVTPGDTEEKIQPLLALLQKAETAYEENQPMELFFPEIPHQEGEGLRDFCQRFHQFLKKEKALPLQQALFAESHFPQAPLTGRQAQQIFIRRQGKKIPLANAKGHISLEAILPYPPGIVVLAPGEVWNQTVLDYFLFLMKYKKEFPAFSLEILGVHEEHGTPYVWVAEDTD